MTFTKAIGGTSLDYGVRVLAVNPGPEHRTNGKDAKAEGWGYPQ